jgi:hypothetical protein
VRRYLSILVIILAAILITGCSQSSPNCKPKKGLAELRLLKVDEASKDAETAYNSGDHRLIGLYGFSVEVPGFDGDPYNHKNEIRMLDGTGDAYCTNEEWMINKNARLYAKKYNNEILNQLKNRTSNN